MICIFTVYKFSYMLAAVACTCLFSYAAWLLCKCTVPMSSVQSIARQL